MKNRLAILTVFIISLVPVFAQEDGSNIAVDPLSLFKPKFDGLIVSDTDGEIKDFEVVAGVVSNITYVKIPTITTYLEHAKKDYDFKNRHNKSEFSYNTTDQYFQVAVNTLKNNRILLDGDNEIRKAKKRFQEIKQAVIASDISDEQLKNVEFYLYYYAAYFQMWQGSVKNLEQARMDFEYIVAQYEQDETFIQDGVDIYSIYSSLAAIYRYLYNNISGNIIKERKYLQMELYYLWQITEHKNEGKEALLDYKIKNLIAKYQDIIDYSGDHFSTIYKPYFDKLGVKYKSLEDRAEDSVDEESTDVNTTE